MSTVARPGFSVAHCTGTTVTPDPVITVARRRTVSPACRVSRGGEMITTILPSTTTIGWFPVRGKRTIVTVGFVPGCTLMIV